ncbi:MAG: hypothetical protein R2874_01440 [Desulfobacterales bacterium]
MLINDKIQHEGPIYAEKPTIRKDPLSFLDMTLTMLTKKGRFGAVTSRAVRENCFLVDRHQLPAQRQKCTAHQRSRPGGQGQFVVFELFFEFHLG